MNKEQILAEIRRTAKANDGKPLGRGRFFQETGIKESDWLGKIWVRWSDAITEAGFEPNRLQVPYSEYEIFEAFIDLIRELGHVPTIPELRFKTHNFPGFPAKNTFTTRFGPKNTWPAKILSYCDGRAEYADVIAICASLIDQKSLEGPDSSEALLNSVVSTKDGYVYMAIMKIGREKRYKIGKAVIVERRTGQIALQLPEELELIHAISTDDAYGIEAYWHNRFKEKNTKGEWFSLSRKDVQAFKRRKYM